MKHWQRCIINNKNGGITDLIDLIVTVRITKENRSINSIMELRMFVVNDKGTILRYEKNGGIVDNYLFSEIFGKQDLQFLLIVVFDQGQIIC